MRLSFPVAVFVTMAFVASPLPAAASETTATQPTPPQEPRTVRLTLSPAKAPEPVLKYTLLPEYLSQTPGNAVQQMFMAAQLAGELSKNEDPDKTYSRVIDWVRMRPETRPTEEIRQVLKKAGPALHYAELASAREYAHWDIPTRTEAYSAMLPPLMPYRLITRLLVLRCELALAEGQYEPALADLKTGLAMARWTAGPTLVQDMVASANASAMMQAVESWMGNAGSANLYWALAHLPRPFVSFQEALEFERLSIAAELPQFESIKTSVWSPEQADAVVHRLVTMREQYDLGKADPRGVWAKVGSASAHLDQHSEMARQALLKRGDAPEMVRVMTPAQAVLLEQFLTFEHWRDNLFILFDLPFWQSFPRMKEWQQELDAHVQANPHESYPFMGLLPNLRAAHFSITRVERSIAALQVIEAIRMHMAQSGGGLPRNLAEVQMVPLPDDPVTGKPFIYERTEAGAKLLLPSPTPDKPQDGVVYELIAAQ